MSNKTGILATIAILTTAATAIWIAPAATADPQTIEGCHWSDTQQNWIYQDDALCRGTGEDPTTDSSGNPACANQLTPIPAHRYGTTIYTCTPSMQNAQAWW